MMNKLLEIRVRQTASRVEAIVKKEFGIRWWQLRREDELRCLRLVQWEEKYRVSLGWIVKTLAEVWKKKFARYQSKGIGVKIPTLVGQKSEEILKAKILELYPNGENVEQWRANEQQRQWLVYRDGIRQKENWSEGLGKAVREYQRRMEREREARKTFEKKARRRPYRGNPWLPE